MTRKSLLILLCLLFPIVAMAEAYEPPAIGLCTHRYWLVELEEEGVYWASCEVCKHQANVQLPDGTVIPGTADPDQCSHQYRRAVAPKKAGWENCSWPPKAWGFHTQRTSYDLVCDWCGGVSEGYTSAMEIYQHVAKLIGDCHMDGEYKHVDIYQCDVCQVIFCEIVECAVFHEGNACMRIITEYQPD